MVSNTASGGAPAKRGASSEDKSDAANGGAAHVDKARRYDRGIRVWGAHGQAALERARVLLLGGGAAGCEALKNLVLGGIASFTVVDGAAVSPRDLGTNYLVPPGSLGAPRAAAVAAGLRELNDLVAGSFVDDAPAALLAANPGFVADFDLVLAAGLGAADAAALDAACRAAAAARAAAGGGGGPALLCFRAYGLAGAVRACVAEHAVVESKPDSRVEDLRLGDPWPELAAAASALDLAALDDHAHSHVPWGLLLVKAAAEWQRARGAGAGAGAAGAGGAPPAPRTAAERAELKAIVASWRRPGPVEGVPADEENFAEAAREAHRVWAPPAVPAEVAAVLAEAPGRVAALAGAAANADFWVLAAAVGRFVAAEGGGRHLPLEGHLPDMHSTTAEYLRLQRLYRAKAGADAAAVARHAAAVAAEAGRPPPPAAEARRFCRHAAELRVVRCAPLEAPGAAAGGGGGGGGGAAAGRGDALRAALAAEDTAADATLLVLLAAADRFAAAHGRFPGAAPGGAAGAGAPLGGEDAALEEDAALLRAAAGAVLAEAGAPGAPLAEDLVTEVVRCGGGEPAAVAALVGAVAAQEAIKLVTGQFVPAAGTLVVNAMRCTTAVFPWW